MPTPPERIADWAEKCHTGQIDQSKFREKLIAEIHSLTSAELLVLADVLSEHRA